MITDDTDLLQKIKNYLIETQPDIVEEIEIFKKANQKYPEFVNEFITNTLKDKPDLHTSYIHLKDGNSQKGHLYDLIFDPQLEKEVKSIASSKIKSNPESNDENIETKWNDKYNDNLIYFEEEEEEEEFEAINDDDNNSDTYITTEHDVIHFDTFEPDITIIDDDFINIDEYQMKINLIIKNVSERLSLTEDIAFLIMKKYNFDYDKFSEDWVKHTNFMDNLPTMINVPPEKIKYPLTIKKIEEKGYCSICCEDNCELYQMYCGHSYCKDCMRMEIEIQIEERKFPICCREDNCEIMAHELTAFIGETKTKQYLNNYLEEQILIDKKYIKCPSPKCPLFLNKYYSYCDFGQCKCGNIFCLKCQQVSHAPLKCEQIDEWNDKCQKMKQLYNQQLEWYKRELSLWKYRKQNIEEIKKVSDGHLDEVNKEYEELFQKETDEIEAIKSLIEKEETDENEKKSLAYRLNRLNSLFNYYQSKKNTEIEFFSNFINSYINALNTDDKFFLYTSTSTIYVKINNIQKLVKKCPKCGVIIDKNGGCNFMKCRICQHEFCWICLQDWASHNKSSKCIYDIDQDNKNDSQDNIHENDQNSKNNGQQDNSQNKIQENDQNVIQNVNQDSIQVNNLNSNQNDSININENNNENDELIQQQAKKFEVPEDHEFRLPPIDAKKHFDFERWKRYNNNYNYHFRQILSFKNESEQNIIYNSSFKYHSILAHSYQLLYLLDPSSGTPYNLFEYYVDQLEHISPYKSNNYLETLLKHANDINFVNQK